MNESSERPIERISERQVPTFEYAKHVWRVHRSALVTTCAVAVGFAVVSWRHVSWFGDKPWDSFDAAITLATLFTALAVWGVGIKDEWLEQRDSRISVFVRLGERELARCSYAPLLGDPRSFAQQIGSQMLGGVQLNFFPVFERTAPQPEFWDGGWIRHQSVTINLRKGPPNIPDAPVTWDKDNGWGRALAEQPVSVPLPQRRYLANAFSLGMLKSEPRYNLTLDLLTPDEARQLAKNAESVVGHESTCDLFSALLQRPVPLARTTLHLSPGDEVIVGQYSGGRLELGATELPDGATVQWVLVKVNNASSATRT